MCLTQHCALELTPAYDATCKRLIFCSDFYPAISRPNAHLITDAITQIEAQGIRTADGKLHELDALILATGFNAAAFVLPARVTGENGVDLETQWDGAPRAHRAVALPRLPKLLDGRRPHWTGGQLITDCHLRTSG